MKHIRTFESYKTVKVKLSAIDEKSFVEAVKESVMNVGDIYKVRSTVDIPQSLINAYVKKVKDTTGKNMRQFYGDVEIAEELVKYITTNGLDIEKIAGNALMGGAQGQTQGQGQAQPQVQVETQAEPQAQPQGQAQTQPQAQPQGQAQEGQGQEGQEFEEPQGQGQAQEGQGQAQEGQGQGQAQEGQTEEEEEKEEGEENEEELPL